MELSGRLTSFPIAELLHWAHNDRRNGCLMVRSSGREKRIFFEQGKIVTATTDEPSEFYGQFLLLAGYLDQKTLLDCLALCRERSQRLGVVLQDEDLLSTADIQRTLRYHLEDLICEIFLWNHGIFFFQTDRPTREDLLAEPISPTQIALEGSHWIDEEKRVRKVLVDDNVVLGRVDEASAEGIDLKPRQRRILEEVDGIRRLEALWGAVHGSYYRFLVAAHELVEMGLVEVVHLGRRTHAAPPELRLDDLLFEQAAKEQAYLRHHAANLAGFERFVPIWVREPDLDEWERMPERVRTFYRAFDGTRRLTEILSADEDAWSREIELLMLQIGKEAVALLPAPLAELEAEKAARTPQEHAWWRGILGIS